MQPAYRLTGKVDVRLPLKGDQSSGPTVVHSASIGLAASSLVLQAWAHQSCHSSNRYLCGQFLCQCVKQARLRAQRYAGSLRTVPSVTSAFVLAAAAAQEGVQRGQTWQLVNTKRDDIGASCTHPFSRRYFDQLQIACSRVLLLGFTERAHFEEQTLQQGLALGAWLTSRWFPMTIRRRCVRGIHEACAQCCCFLWKRAGPSTHM